MSTRNIVPRNDNEGQLGTEKKKWEKIYTNEISATNVVGNLIGTADKAVKDISGAQIDTTYLKINEIGNEQNKIPRYSSEGHLILPSGIEIW